VVWGVVQACRCIMGACRIVCSLCRSVGKWFLLRWVLGVVSVVGPTG
jgi:hypothetical protein